MLKRICHCCCVFRNDIHYYDIQIFDHLNPEYDFCDIFLFSVSFLFTKMIISINLKGDKKRQFRQYSVMHHVSENS